MNNFFDFKEQFMNNFNLRKNETNNDLYSPYEGFIRGNLYKELYDPYKISQPYQIRPMNEQAEILTKIDALCFSCVDLNLYLDVFPDDTNMIDLYNKYNREKESLIKDYESRYGPLKLSSESLNVYPWAWNKLPWPWNGN